ncbi:MAG: chromate resistance protein [Variovorax sp.]|nr:chromate resistance protein [Variovorax sp.]
MTDWLLLTATLPTSPSALRVRVWRALKATGAGTLREGVYLLPTKALTAPDLWDLEATIGKAGAAAHMLAFHARDEAQDLQFRSLFDRSGEFADLLQSIKEIRASIRTSTEVQLRKALRALEQRLQSIQAIDFFPTSESVKVADALARLRRDAEGHYSPGEPAPSSGAIARRGAADHQGRKWATRRRPWVDRLATAWLIMRFIDRKPTFVWLSNPSKVPKDALGFDFDGATFTHVGGQVTFQVTAQSFGLTEDVALERLGQLVHYIDVGGTPVEEAAGVELAVRGLQAQYADDDELLAAAVTLFDSLYVGFKVCDEQR